jgi:hypothetical protein
MINIGDIVVCIDTMYAINSIAFSNVYGNNKYIITEVEYDLNFEHHSYIRLKTTNNVELNGWYMVNRFISLIDYRKQKLKRLRDV